MIEEDNYSINFKESVSLSTPKGLNITLHSSSKSMDELKDISLELLNNITKLNGLRNQNSYTG